MWPRTDLLDLLGITHPIIQAPMSGFSGPAITPRWTVIGCTLTDPLGTSFVQMPSAVTSKMASCSAISMLSTGKNRTKPCQCGLVSGFSMNQKAQMRSECRFAQCFPRMAWFMRPSNSRRRSRNTPIPAPFRCTPTSFVASVMTRLYFQRSIQAGISNLSSGTFREGCK